MNWNGQRPYINHFVATRSNPLQAASLQADLKARRRSRLFDACLTRPVYLNLRFEMNAAGQTAAYRDTTQTLGYDVLIIGAKSDLIQTREIIVKSAETERSLVRVGGSSTLNLRIDEFAGLTPGNGGQTGVMYLPSPIPLAAGERITAEVFKTDTTAAVEVGNIVLLGIRVLDKTYAESVLAAEADQIEQLLKQREFPQEYFQKVTFDFDSAVVGGESRNILSHRIEEPCLIRGFRTSLRFSMVEIGIAGDLPWTPEATPCWAIGAEDEVGHDNWIWTPKPIYLRRYQQIEIRRIENGAIDEVQVDAQTGNTFTMICETV